MHIFIGIMILWVLVNMANRVDELNKRAQERDEDDNDSYIF